MAVLAWASLWMLAAPLFHIHPEADHQHGKEGHLHGGTVHMAWSPDLACEYDDHQHIDRNEKYPRESAGKFTKFSHLGDRHTEFSLSLLTDSTDRKSLKPLVAQALGLLPAVGSDIERHTRIQRDTAAIPSPVSFVHTLSPRAPPGFLV